MSLISAGSISLDSTFNLAHIILRKLYFRYIKQILSRPKEDNLYFLINCKTSLKWDEKKFDSAVRRELSCQRLNIWESIRKKVVRHSTTLSYPTIKTH
jgi:hypothetical protein